MKVVEKKEMPTWISESTVRTAEDQVRRIHKCDLLRISGGRDRDDSDGPKHGFGGAGGGRAGRAR